MGPRQANGSQGICRVQGLYQHSGPKQVRPGGPEAKQDVSKVCSTEFCFFRLIITVLEICTDLFAKCRGPETSTLLHTSALSFLQRSEHPSGWDRLHILEYWWGHPYQWVEPTSLAGAAHTRDRLQPPAARPFSLPLSLCGSKELWNWAEWPRQGLAQTMRTHCEVSFLSSSCP